MTSEEDFIPVVVLEETDGSRPKIHGIHKADDKEEALEVASVLFNYENVATSNYWIEIGRGHEQ